MSTKTLITPLVVAATLVSIFHVNDTLSTSIVFHSNHDDLTGSASNKNKFALIIAISHYSSDSGWDQLSSANDVALIESALIAHRFSQEDIAKLDGRRIDRQDILNEIRRKLIDKATEGDIVFFHYSGHGHRITDNNHDELDGYDEVLVPYNAPRRPPADYDGARHLRDDDIGSLILDLRRKLGPTGDLILSLDSCYSGTLARGNARARGDPDPIGEPQPRGADPVGIDTGGGFADTGFASPASSTANESTLSPYTVFSASRHNQLAYETRDENKKEVGSLSLGISRSLLRSNADSTYREVFVQVQKVMAASPGVRNTPQVEGSLDRKLFGGAAVSQEPYFIVISHDQVANTVTLKGGSLTGLLPGALVDIHETGTRDPDPASYRARGKVKTASLNLAVIDLEHAIAGSRLKDDWAFVTAQAFGGLSISVQLSLAESAWKSELAELLKSSKVADVVASDADLIITEKASVDGTLPISITTTADAANVFSYSGEKDDKAAKRIVKAIEDYGRNRFLRRLELQDPLLNVRFEILPCELECIANNETGEMGCNCPLTADTSFVTESNETRLEFGDTFRLKLHNDGQSDAHVAVLDLMPDGQISLLWPRPEHVSSANVLQKDKSYMVVDPPYFQIGPPTGVDVFKLIATREFVDFRPVTSDFDKLPAGDGSRGPFDLLFEETLTGARGANPGVTPSLATTYSSVVTIASDSN